MGQVEVIAHEWLGGLEIRLTIQVDNNIAEYCADVGGESPYPITCFWFSTGAYIKLTDSDKINMTKYVKTLMREPITDADDKESAPFKHYGYCQEV